MDLLSALPREHRFTNFIFDHPTIVAALTVGYLAFALKLGPHFMRDRKPYDVKLITRIFNLAQVAANAWYCSWAIELWWRYLNTGRGIQACGPPTYEMPEIPQVGDTANTIFFCTFYYYVRVFDFMDTIFFVLTKKFTHISFLHVYHHVMVVTSAFIYLRFGWTNTIFHVSIINSLVHIVMYSYYFLATFPSLRPYLWWKRYLTALQLVQFVAAGLQVLYLMSANCKAPRLVLCYNMSQVFMMLLLFGRFYAKSYSGNKPRTDSKAISQKTNVD